MSAAPPREPAGPPLHAGSRRLRRGAGAFLAALALLSALYAASPHKSLIRRRLLPGYWLLALEGKTLYDPDLRIVRHGDPARREVALTIDDGPHPEFSSRMMDALKAAGARATFYVIGSEVKKHPGLVRRMIAEGHEVGNHTNEHLRLPTLTDHEVLSTLKNAEINVRLATGGYRMRTLRPPGGEIDARTAGIARDLGYTTLLWSDTPGDYLDQPASAIEARVLDGLEPGAVILIHDGSEGTVRALPALLAELKRQGYRTVTASEMARHLGRPRR